MTPENVLQEGVGEAARFLGGNFDDNDIKSLHDNTYYHSQPPQKIPTVSKEFVAFLLLNTQFPSFYEGIKKHEDATRIKFIAHFIKQYIEQKQETPDSTINIQGTRWKNESPSVNESYYSFACETEKLYIKALRERKSVQLQAQQEENRLRSQGLFLGRGQMMDDFDSPIDQRTNATSDEDFCLFSNNEQYQLLTPPTPISNPSSPRPPGFNSVENSNFFPPLTSIQHRSTPGSYCYDDDTLPEDMPSLF